MVIKGSSNSHSMRMLLQDLAVARSLGIKICIYMVSNSIKKKVSYVERLAGVLTLDSAVNGTIFFNN